MSKLIVGKNDLLTRFPNLAAEWDYEKNYPKTPDHISYGDNHKYYWLCPKGHPSYLMSPNSRTNDGTGCQVCANRKLLVGFNDLSVSYPKLAAEWDYELNQEGPDHYLFNSTEQVYWICPNGHGSYPRKINDRVKGKGCTKCARQHAVDLKRATAIANKGSVKTLFPELAAEWDYSQNAKGPECYPTASSEAVFWVCSWCHQPWQATIASRTKSKSGCPHCRFRSKTSFPEQAIYFYLSQYYSDAQNSYSETLQKMELDIYIPSLKIGVEYDGIHWHNQIEKDRLKYSLCKEQGIYLIRVRESGEDASSICDDLIVRSDYSSYSSLDEAIVNVFKTLGCSRIPHIDTERDCVNIRGRYYASLRENSLLFKYPEIAKEWHPTKNGDITPDMVSAGVNTKYWWKCPICGEDYPKSISSRVRGIGCNKCSSRNKAAWAHIRNLQKGVNDVKTLRPDLIQEWDHSINPGVLPEECTLGSREPVIWRCKICDSTWPASIYARVHGSGCPQCARIKAGKSQKKGSIEKYGSLAEAFPSIAIQWDFSNNNGLTPDDFSPIDKTPGMHWICSRCGKPFVSSIINLTKSKFVGCRKCRYEQAGEERKANPELSPFFGKHHSEEAKRKISQANSGTKNSQYGKKGALSPNYGMSFSDEHKRKISQALKGKKKTEQTKAKLSEAKKGKPNPSKAQPVRQLSLDGLELRQFESIKAAEKALGITAKRSSIGAVCKGEKKTAYGYKWEYVDKIDSKQSLVNDLVAEIDPASYATRTVGDQNDRSQK